MTTADSLAAVDSIEAALRRATIALSGRSESARLDAEILLAAVLEVNRAGLIARAAQSLHVSQQRAFESLVAKRIRGMPVAYLTEAREFWSMNLYVSPAVLVPRPETEILVEQVLRMAPKHPPRSLLDLGTGSGAIALAIAMERPQWRIAATDVSDAALQVAQRNGRELKIRNVRWQLGAWFDSLEGQHFDFIVSNPPYVASNDSALLDLAFEPQLALTPGPSGLEALQAIVAQAPAHLLAGGSLLLEHGQDQAAAVQLLLLQRNHFDSIGTCLDLAGKSRVTFGTLHTP